MVFNIEPSAQFLRLVTSPIPRNDVTLMATAEVSPEKSGSESPVALASLGAQPLSETKCLVPCPRNLTDAAAAVPFAWLWEEKNEKGEVRFLDDFDMHTS